MEFLTWAVDESDCSSWHLTTLTR